MRPLTPREPFFLIVNPPGFLRATAKVPGGPWTDEAHVDVALQRGAVVTGRAIPPADGHMALSLEKETSPGTWRAMAVAGTEAVRRDAEGRVRVDGLAAGTYRLADRSCSGATAGVEVATGGEATLPVLDLSSAGTVKGRVEGPDGFAIGARVVVEGDG